MTYRVGVFLPEFKWDRMHLREIDPVKHSLKLEEIGFDSDLSQYSAVIHKFTYQMVDGHDEQVRKVEEYCRSHPSLVVIEDIERVRLFTDRILIQNAIKAGKLPDYAQYVEGEIWDRTKALDLGFPILLKSRSACGTPESHEIQVVSSREQLEAIENKKYELVAYPFIPHYGTVFKCYGLGDHFVFRSNSSLVVHENTCISFDSQKQLPPELSSESSTSQTHGKGIGQKQVEEIGRALEGATGVSLIGFDVLVDERDGTAKIVDVNYFPCFRGIEDIPGKIAGYILEKLNKAKV